MKIIHFPGDLNDISAKKEALGLVIEHSRLIVEYEKGLNKMYAWYHYYDFSNGLPETCDQWIIRECIAHQQCWHTMTSGFLRYIRINHSLGVVTERYWIRTPDVGYTDSWWSHKFDESC